MSQCGILYTIANKVNTPLKLKNLISVCKFHFTLMNPNTNSEKGVAPLKQPCQIEQPTCITNFDRKTKPDKESPRMAAYQSEKQN